MESQLKQKSQDLCEEKLKFNELKDDFKYNLKLLEDRDAELVKHEQALICEKFVVYTVNLRLFTRKHEFKLPWVY